MRRFGPELAANGVTFRLSPGYSSTGRLLFIEYFNSLASWGRVFPARLLLGLQRCCLRHFRREDR